MQNESTDNNIIRDTENPDINSSGTNDYGSNTQNEINNISYYPTDKGYYNYFASKTPPKTNNGIPGKQVIALVILVSVISTFVGFLSARISYRLIDAHDRLVGNIQQSSSPDNVIINVVPSRPKVETTEISHGEHPLLTIPEVCAAVMESNVEITTETVVYDQRLGLYVTEGAGSGVIISDNGYIITNHHVVENARTITVTLSNGNSYKASVVGSDSTTDIAVLSISTAETLSSAVLGNSDDVLQGDSVVIVGNPLGTLGSSVTNGIISALDREITIDDKSMTLIQTNAPVNPGNSGGGMFNMYGELIGIVNAKTTGDNIEGIGFAIPINFAYTIASQIIEYGYVRGRVDHGLTVIEVKDMWDMARYNVSKIGVYIYKSEFETQLKSGDRIVSMNGVEIDLYTDIKKALLNCAAGDTIKIVVERKNKQIEYDLTLREYVPTDSNFN